MHPWGGPFLRLLFMIMSKPFLTTHNLSKSYGSHAVLFDIALSITKGSVTAIMGKSGSGKTTLLNLIGGLDRPSEGKIIIDGVTITDMNERQLNQFRAEKIGFVFQFFNLFNELTVWENIVFPTAIMKKGINEKQVSRVAHILEIDKLMDRTPPQLSGGEQQRVAIARAVSSNPGLLLMDEPTGNLDESNAQKIVNLIKDLNTETGMTIVLATHDYDVAHAADTIIGIRDGKCFDITKTKPSPR